MAVYDTPEKKRMYLIGRHPTWKSVWTMPEFKLDAIFKKEHDKDIIEQAKLLNSH